MPSPSKKRSLEDVPTERKPKKAKTSSSQKTHPARETKVPSALVQEEVDFPRGGGTSFTPLEVKAIRAEAAKEADAELFEESTSSKKPKKGSKGKKTSGAGATSEKREKLTRIEHLNYKRIAVGMKILGQIISIQPLALIVSLPNQLFAHIPITHISSQLTSLLDRMDEDDADVEDEEEEEEEGGNAPRKPRVPELAQMFEVGQYVRGAVTAVHSHDATDAIVVGKSRDDMVRASRRVELSLFPGLVNSGVQVADLKPGFTLTAAVKSIEDHGYILDLGLSESAGFLTFKDAQKSRGNSQLDIGSLLNVTVTNLSGKGRTCNVSLDPTTFSSSSLSEVSSITSILPGTLVQTLITNAQTGGLNVQMLGFFEGTVDRLHFRNDAIDKTYKVGKKIKARVLYEIADTPPRFALSLAEHIVGLGKKEIETEQQDLEASFPIGTILEAVKVVKIESERGLYVEILPNLQAFVHISYISDDHIPSLSSSGPWKVGSLHKARVTGYFPFDGLLQVSLKPSVLNEKFMQVTDVEVGEVIRGTIRKLSDSGLFVTISRNLDGVVWPNHYADILLKQPSKRFKVGGSIKCRVLVVDSDRHRVSLTAKKSLLDSTLPILAKYEDATSGTIVHGVVFKVLEKQLMVEFYNNLKATIPLKETSDTPVSDLRQSFSVGKVVKVRIISSDPERRRIVATLRQNSVNTPSNLSEAVGVEIGSTVTGVVEQIHNDNAVLALRPSNVRALLSLKNLANHRKVTLDQISSNLRVGEELDQLLIVTRNLEKNFVIVASKPQSAAGSIGKAPVSMNTVTIGQVVGGRITRHTHRGAFVKLTNSVGGLLSPTDTCDNYATGNPFPPIDTVLKAVVVEIDQTKNQLILSSRPSKLYPDRSQPVADREIVNVADLKIGETIRGFIKSVADHGLFVTIGRDIDARVQIRELFDEYIKEWQPKFQTHQLVTGRVLSVNLDTKKVELTFRTGSLTRENTALTLSDLKVGQKIVGNVKKVTDYGLFIQVEKSKVNGLCHKSELSDNKDADVSLALRGFREGDRVKAIVLGIKDQKLSLSLKPSHFSDDDDEDAVPDEGLVAGQDDEAVSGEESDEDMSPAEGGGPEDSGASDSDDDGDEDAMQIDLDQLVSASQSAPKQPKPSTSTKPAAALKLGGGFQWFGDEIQAGGDLGDGEPSSSEDEDGDQLDKKKKRKKKTIELDLTADLQTKTPESNSDFERLLLGSPNSSYLWIQYMSFQLQLSEADKAREIARKALRTINFREEQEKLNVWIALLNLENSFGTDESLEAVFKEAARANDSKTIHLRLAGILDQSEKTERAEEQYKRTCKKFSRSSKVWTLFGEFYLRHGQIEQSRQLLPRSLLSLEKQKHLKTISKFAQLEYKLGDPERGRTVFEGIVDSHPKRWDLWSIYIDMEVGQGNIQSIRNIFDRVLMLKMTSHKAKFFFKKWLELERRLGDEEGATAVKEKAIEWTQKANAS